MASTAQVAATGSPTPTTVEAPAPFDDSSFVYHVDLVLIALMAFFILTRLPRVFALFWSSEWLNGHILYHIPHRPSRRVVQAVHSTFPPPREKGKGQSSDDSHTSSSDTQIQRLDEKGAPVAINFPPHISLSVKIFRPLLSCLRTRVAPGMSIFQVLVMTIYFAIVFYCGLYRSNVFTDNTRTGWIALAQLPFVFVFAQKNNVFGSLIGCGYEKLNFLHRFVGRIVVLAANIHSLNFFYKWILKGTFMEEIKSSVGITGMIALVSLDVIYLFSVEFVRNKAYNFFLTTHIIGFIIVLPAVYLHVPDLLPYPLACACLYAYNKAYIRPLPELDLTRVEIPSVNAGWRAGQHVRLRVCSFGMGWGGWLEVHPFTIASVSQNGPEGMVLMCKRAGGWTRKLYEMAKMGGYTEGGVGREVRVLWPRHTVFASYSAAVFVAGGSGITYALSAIEDLVQKDLKGESRVKIIELVWSVTDPACLAPLLPTFISLIQQSVFTPLRISVFYTRAPTGKQPPPAPQPPASHFPPGLTLAPGRPRLAKFLEGAQQRAVTLSHGSSRNLKEEYLTNPKDDGRLSGMIVSVCGPLALVDDVVAAVNGLDSVRRDQVGGVEICEEALAVGHCFGEISFMRLSRVRSLKVLTMTMG
ncbi:hypothetical protein CPB84DRAFT_1813372 [Gymnopilus junonius]|uniref:ferric-chelate reductase (NADPH) n=1 Tax=Gymnopilus junonius TaxID=109634 RepID=A0A9P5TR79_GYMJU|nr:hypothetical protein CPB84DRAFT_1813372 [Gymnopilus junonius]